MEESLDGGSVEVGEIAGEEEEEEEEGLKTTSSRMWGDSSKLLFQLGYLKVLKELALSGQLQLYNIRGVCWRLFLGCLPEERSQWIEATQKSREHYDVLKKKHVLDPHMATASLDVAINNPLSQDEGSPWHQFFMDTELRQMIDQDVVRTFPDVQFFRQDHIQDSLLNILFCYAKEHQDISYRQGMHELLAPILFVLHAEMRDVHSDNTLAPVLKVVMDPDYIEHDAYTIFLELMECVQPWYMITALEADTYRVKSQNSHKMNLDPRICKPFASADNFPPTSAITRKLDMIHNVLLKKADETLFFHLKALSIPPQTYGIRWIRLLFGREFPLPNVLELWDALFADGPSLSLMDYVCVAMLMHIREVLMGGDYALCMQHLMHFPTVYEVTYLIQRALHLRNPTNFPSPRIWNYKPATSPLTHRPPFTKAYTLPASYHHPPQGRRSPSPLNSRAAKAKHALTTATKKALSRPGNRGTGGGGEGREELRLGMDSHDSSLLPPAQPEGRRGRARGRSTGADTTAAEMISNPKSHPDITVTSPDRLERVTTRLDNLEAKCQYCGSKMESLLLSLQEEVTELPNLSPEAENTIYLSIAGLKHVRDLLLKKIPFSGEMMEGWEMRKKEDQKDSDASEDHNAPSKDGALLSATQNSASVEVDETDSHPLLGSGEGVTFVRLEGDGQGDRVCEGVRWEGENSSEWVKVSHPLNGD